MAGCFTVNRLIPILQAMIPIINTPVSSVINLINPDVIMYTQVSAGLAIAVGVITLFILVSVVWRVGKFKPGKVGRCIQLAVSKWSFNY